MFSHRSHLRSLAGVKLLSTGSYVPDRVVTNEELARQGFDEEWILQRTGIRERRHLEAGKATSDMAVAAGRLAIERSGLSPADIDLLVVGTFTPDMPVPTAACLVQEKLGLTAAAFDLNSGCAGFMYALVTGMQFVATGASHAALVIGADCNSRVVAPADMKMYPLFGDGAGAVVLVPGEKTDGLLAYTLGADGSGADLLCRPMGGSKIPPSIQAIEENLHGLRMDGRAVFKWAVQVLEDSVRRVVGHAGLTLDDIALFILHQANRRILDAAAEALGIDSGRLLINVDRYGNTSAASVPLALDEAVCGGRLRRGDLVVLAGFGAGLAWGTAVLRW